MSKYKVGDVVKILDDGAWNGVLNENLEPKWKGYLGGFGDICFKNDLQGCGAEIVDIGEEDYIFNLLSFDNVEIKYITMSRTDVGDDYLEMVSKNETKPVKSDGGSSSYYDIPLPEWLVERILDRQSEGEAFIKTEEIITVAFGNDFDYGNLFKSEVRAWGAMNGAGKEGNSVGYELNKMRYSIDKIQEAVERGE